MISPSQCRAARGLLAWSQADLARHSRVNPSTIQLFEAEKHTPKEATVLLLKLCLEAQGIRFIGLTGVDRPVF
tara:strand:- start:483 stop:701 length:219 start_codon:yes stop_codon:yes gene_type:complete